MLAVADEDSYVDDGGDLGWQPVGPECRKKLPPEFVHVETVTNASKS